MFNEFVKNSHKFPNIEKLSINIVFKTEEEEGVTIDKLLEFKNLKTIKYVDKYNSLQEDQANLSKIKGLEEINFLNLGNHLELKKFKYLKRIKNLKIYRCDHLAGFVDIVKNIQIEDILIRDIFNISKHDILFLENLNKKLRSLQINSLGPRRPEPRQSGPYQYALIDGALDRIVVKFKEKFNLRNLEIEGIALIKQ